MHDGRAIEMKENIMRCGIISVCFIFALVSTAQAITVHVPADQPTIQAGIDAAVDGDTVLVAPGTYVENINFNGKAITVKSGNGAEVTTIDGNQSGTVVAFGNGEELDSIIDGFTITNGLAGSGGGITCGENSSPTIKSNIITGNNTNGNIGHTGGGGIFTLSSSPLIIDNLISQNTGDWSGGGIYCYYYSNPIITNNIIIYNKAVSSAENGHGGGIACRVDSSPLIMNNVICHNESNSNAGGIYCFLASSPAIVNNIIFGNKASIVGGGICLQRGNSPTIYNSILWNNTAPAGHEIAVLFYHTPSSLSVSYSDVQGGEAGVFVDSSCTLNWGAGMIDADPLFVDPTGGDFHLKWDSPCRDTGDNSAPNLPAEDFEGDPRIAYGTVDMGADEFYHHLYYTGNATPGASIELKFTDLPGSSPVGLYYCVSGVLDPPIPGAYGSWYLLPPVFGTGPIGTIPSNGVMVLPIALPSSLPAPFDIYMQAIIGTPLKLTNLCTINVE